jgi:hypothetical protein
LDMASGKQPAPLEALALCYLSWDRLIPTIAQKWARYPKEQGASFPPNRKLLGRLVEWLKW